MKRSTTPVGVVSVAALMLAAFTPQVGQNVGPEQFAVGVLNTDADEYGPVLTADGNEIFFTIRRDRCGAEHLVTSRRSGDSWSRPETLPFSGRSYDKEPYLSPDGTQLFFASRRPVPSGESLDFEIWVADRTSNGWSEPRHVVAVGSPANDNYPAVARNGNLYFGSARTEGRGRIFRAVWNGTAYGEPEVIVAGGSPLAGADPYIDPDERFMVLSSTQAGGLGEGDLYLTTNQGGSWSTPVHLGSVVNSADYEFTPFVSRDGEYLYFSRGWGEMWRILVVEVPQLSAALRRR